MDFQPPYPGYVDKIHRSFGGQGLMRSFDAHIDDLAPGSCTISAPILPVHCQQHGHAYAGLTFAIGDSAAGYAALSLMPEEAEVLTVEMKINLLAPAKGTLLRAAGRILKSGRRPIVVAAEVIAVSDGTERQVVVLQGTMIPIR